MLKAKVDFFMMEDNLKATSDEYMRTLKTYLDDRDEDEYRFKLSLQRYLE